MKPENYTIRPEEKEDYRAVETLVRESFWNARATARRCWKARTIRSSCAGS